MAPTFVLLSCSAAATTAHSLQGHVPYLIQMCLQLCVCYAVGCTLTVSIRSQPQAHPVHSTYAPLVHKQHAAV